MVTTTIISSFNLGDCRVDVTDNSLCFVGQDKLSLQPKFIEVLAQLAKGYPEVVTREQLIETVWDGNEYVGSKALTNAIWHLRQHLTPLGQDTVIETVRKTGYRLLVAPEFDLLPEEELAPVEEDFRRFRRRTQVSVALAVCAALVLGLWLFNRPPTQVSAKITSLTREEGSERYASVSPDGKHLVYGAARHGSRYSLYIKELGVDGAIARRLTPRDSEESRAVWHPGGEKLYFASLRAEDDQCFITEMTIKSGHMRYLTSCNTHRAALDISPDGKQLSLIHRMPDDRGHEVYLIDLVASEPVPVKLNCADGCSGFARDLAFSPDGKTLAVARRLSNITEDIFLYDLATESETPLTQGMEDIRGLTWHEDGRQLVFGVESSGVRKGFHLDIATKTVTDLNVSGFSYPKFIRGSHKLVYNHYARQYDIAYMDLGHEITQTPFPLFYSGDSQRLPDYSSVAGRVVYTSNETGFNEIWTSDLKGRNRIQHTVMEGRAMYPRWSADGRKIAFIAPDELNEGNQINVLDLDSGELAVVPSPYTNHTRVFWGPGDSALYCSVNDSMVKFSLDGTPPSTIGDIDFHRGQVLDNRQLVYSRADLPGLWQLDLIAYEAALDGGTPLPEPVPLIRGRSSSVDWHNAPEDVLMSDRVNWVATEEGVYFKQRVRRGQHMLSYWDRSTNQNRGLIRLPSNFLSSFGTLSYIPEKQRLLMTLTDFPQRDVMLLEHPLLN